MKVLLLDNYDSFTYNLAQLIEENASTALQLDIVYNDQIDLETVKQYDKIVLSPGAGIPSEAGKMLELIKAYASSKSILGVCLGHQAIAEVFGALLVNLSQVYHGLAYNTELVAEDYLFEGIAKHFEVGLYHSWAVEQESLPDCLEATAFSEQQILMAFRHKTLDIRGIQFHPESIMTPSGAVIISNWLRG